MAPLTFEVDKSKYASMLLGSVAFVAIGIWLAMSEGEWFGWVCAAFFGACAAVFVWQMMQSGPRLTISDDGIHDRSLGVGTIAWGDVLDARPTSSGGQPFVSLDLRNPEAYLQRLGASKRKLAGASKAFGFSDLSLNLGGLRGADPAEIAEIVRSHASARRAV